MRLSNTFPHTLQDNIMRGKLSFGEVDDTTAVIDPNEVVGDDYANTTELMLNSAASKAQSRMQRSNKFKTPKL